MFIKLNQIDGENQYPCLVNIERVMWVDPLQDGTCRLYMNVADNDGTPATLDVNHDLDEVEKLLTKEKDHADK